MNVVLLMLALAFSHVFIAKIEFAVSLKGYFPVMGYKKSGDHFGISHNLI